MSALGLSHTERDSPFLSVRYRRLILQLGRARSCPSCRGGHIWRQRSAAARSLVASQASWERCKMWRKTRLISAHAWNRQKCARLLTREQPGAFWAISHTGWDEGPGWSYTLYPPGCGSPGDGGPGWGDVHWSRLWQPSTRSENGRML